MTKTREEYYVGIRFKVDENSNKWTNARFYYPECTSLADRYCKTEDEARAVLRYAYRKFNRAHSYNENGERYEVNEAAPEIGVMSVITKENDKALRIVKHIIKKRTVTEWETIDKA